MSSDSQEYVAITAMLAAGDLDGAAAEIDRVKHNLPLPVLLECLGNVHYYKGEFQQAMIKYEAAMDADKSYDVARYHCFIGIRKERAGDLVEAFKRYQAAIEIEPSFVDPYIELGGLLANAKDYEGALTCYTDALRLDNSDLRNFANRTEVLRVLSEANPVQFAVEYRAAVAEFENAKQHLQHLREDPT